MRPQGKPRVCWLASEKWPRPAQRGFPGAKADASCLLSPGCSWSRQEGAHGLGAASSGRRARDVLLRGRSACVSCDNCTGTLPSQRPSPESVRFVPRCLLSFVAVRCFYKLNFQTCCLRARGDLGSCPQPGLWALRLSRSLAPWVRLRCCVPTPLPCAAFQDFFFYSLVYDPQQKTLLADKGEIRVGNRYQADITDLLKEGGWAAAGPAPPAPVAGPSMPPGDCFLLAVVFIAFYKLFFCSKSLSEPLPVSLTSGGRCCPRGPCARGTRCPAPLPAQASSSLGVVGGPDPFLQLSLSPGTQRRGTQALVTRSLWGFQG